MSKECPHWPLGQKYRDANIAISDIFLAVFFKREKDINTVWLLLVQGNNDIC